MIRVRLQVGNGIIYDTYDEYGLMYLSSDNRFSAPTKGFATSTYAEEAGEYIDPRTVDDAFDYKVKFCIETLNRNLTSANAKIRTLNELMFSKGAQAETGRDGIKTFTTFTFYNEYKRVKIVGTPQPIAEVDEGDLRKYTINGIEHDLAVVELTIRVNDPSLCDFDYQFENEPIYISLTTDGTNIYVHPSRKLKENEHPVLLRRGMAVTHRGYWLPPSPPKDTAKRRHRWQVYYKYPNVDKETQWWPFSLDEYTNRIQTDSIDGGFNSLVKWSAASIGDERETRILKIKKAQKSKKLIPFRKGANAKCCFGIAIYRQNIQHGSLTKFISRVSNVCYFRSNVRATSDEEFEQWLSV